LDILEKVLQLENEADKFGFRWENTAQIMQQIHSECIEIQEHLDKPSYHHQALQDEIGDLLHAVFSLAVFCQFEPRNTLQKTLSKFERRLNAVKALAHADGLSDLNGHSFDELMCYWNKAKSKIG